MARYIYLYPSYQKRLSVDDDYNVDNLKYKKLINKTL